MRLSEITGVEYKPKGQRLSDVLKQEQADAPTTTPQKKTGFAAGMGGGITSTEGLPTPEQSKSLLKRLGKHAFNFFPEMEQGIYKAALKYNPGWYEQRKSAQDKILAGELGDTEKQRLQEYLKTAEKRGEAFQPFDIEAPETAAEYGVDVAAGLGKFIGRLALLRKAMPKGTSEGILWEMESQMAGNAPGKGTATYLAFQAPGKLIKGKTAAAAATRLAAESGIMTGITATEQLVNEGKLDPVELGISAGIPVAFRIPGFIKAGMRLGSKRTKNAIVLYKGGKERVVVTPSEVGEAERIFKQKPETRAERLLGPGEGQKRLSAGKEVKRLPAQTQKALPMTAAERQSRRYKLNQDRIDKRAVQLYDELLAKGEEGSKKSQKKISEFIQGQNLPTLESLYERVNAGDDIAAQMIQEGLYSGSPESFIEGFRIEAAKELKIPYDVNKLKNRWTYVEGRTGEVQTGELVPRTYGHNQPVPEPQKNIFRTDGGRIILDESTLEVRKSRKRSKKFPFGYETELFDPTTGERAIPAPELTRGMRETEGQYKQRVYGVPEKPVVEGAVTREPRLQPGVTHERGAEALPPGARQLPGGETMVSAGEAVSPKRPERPAPTEAPKSAPPKRTNVVEVEPVKIETAADTAAAKFEEWTPKAKRLNRTERKEARKKFRAEQAAGGEASEQEAMEKGLSASKILRSIKKGFRGKMPKPTIEPPNLTDKEWDSLSAKVIKEYPKDVFARSTAQEALDTIRLRKEIPAPYDLGLLEPIIGTKTVVKLANEAYRAKTYNSADYLRLVRDGLKSTFGYDIQAARALRGIMFRHPIIYSQAVSINTKSYILELANAVSTKSKYLTFLSNNYSERLAKEMKSRPSWEFGKEIGVNYLNDNPWAGSKAARLEQYGQFPEALDKLATSALAEKHAPSLAKVVKGWSTWLKASEKGANLGIDHALQRMVEAASKKGDVLVKRGISPEKLDKFYKNRAKVINEFTKRVTAKNPKWKQIQSAANWILFSPSYTVSRPMGTLRSIANLFTNPKDRTYAMQLTLSNIASISAIGSVFAWVGHKWRMQNPTEEPLIDGTNNPTDSMWGKGRVGNHVFDFSFGEASYYRLLARIGMSAYYYSTEAVLGAEKRTEVGGRPLAPAGEEFMNYLNSRETVIVGAAKTLLTGKDWLGRPIERRNELLNLIPFETVLSIIEAGQADGLWESIAEGDYSEASKDAFAAASIGLAGFSSIGTASYPVPAAATRSSYRDIIAMEAHDRQWDDLTPIEQKKLQLKNRKQFKKFEALIAKERVETPINREKIIAEEKAAGDRIRSQLTPGVRVQLEEVPLNVSRRPKDFYLNDERNNRYEALIVEYLNARLPKTKSQNVKVLNSIVTSAKTKAWLQLKKEIKAEQ